MDAAMNYRKRGLVYFSGFDFRFTGAFDTGNPFDRDIKPVEVTVDALGGRRRVEVRDHGPGISPANQARIFQRFLRPPPTRAAPGSASPS